LTWDNTAESVRRELRGGDGLNRRNTVCKGDLLRPHNNNNNNNNDNNNNNNLQMSEREKLPKLKTNNKLIKLQEEINGVIEELLEEQEMNITDINNLIYAAAIIMTQPLNGPSKRRKNRSNGKCWKIRIQKQIDNWRKELSIIAETGTGSDNGKLNWKKRKIFKKYSVTNARELAQLTETLKQKVQAKAQRIRRYEKRENQYIQNKLFKEDTKKIYRNLGIKSIETKDHPPMPEAEVY
jgi:hypothetical protein